jgi:hypothetical protein
VKTITIGIRTLVDYSVGLKNRQHVVGIPTCRNPNTPEGLESRLPVRIHRILAKLPHSTGRASMLEL